MKGKSPEGMEILRPEAGIRRSSRSQNQSVPVTEWHYDQNFGFLLSLNTADSDGISISHGIYKTTINSRNRK